MPRKKPVDVKIPDGLYDIEISIVGKSHEKGTLFEFMIQAILAKQGYGDFQIRARGPGMELDLICTNNVTSEKILVEAKAHKKPIATSELEIFHSKIMALREKGIELGIFWSLSGINSSAAFWYNSLPDKMKQFLKIKGGKDFYNMLQDTGTVGSKNSINSELKPLINKDFFSQELVFCKNSWYYIQFFGKQDAVDSFTILDAFGKIVDNFTCRDIRKQYSKLQNLKLILLSSRRQILESFLKKDKLTIDEITRELKESRVDIQATVDDLVQQNLLTSYYDGEQKFMIKRGLETFLAVSNEFKQNVSTFMKSAYLQSSITNELMNFIIHRFVIAPPKKQIKSIEKLIVISPSALEYCLRSADVPAQDLHAQFNDKNSIVNKSKIADLISRLCILTLGDMGQRKGVLGLQHTRAIEANIHLKLATMNDLYLDVGAKYTRIVARAAGPIRLGEAVQITHPDGFIYVSNLQRNLGQTKLAIKTLKDLLSNYENDDGDWKKAAYVRLGLFSTELNKFEDAKFFLLKATSLYPEVIEGWLNLGNLYLAMGSILEAEKIFSKALKKNPSMLKLQYGLCRVLIAQKKTEQCILKLAPILIKEKRFVDRINKDAEFRTFKRSNKYRELLKKLNLRRTYC